MDEIAGSTAERVAGVSAIISKHRAPPTPLLDAHFLEEQMGDGVFGPSDYREFYVVEVAPQDLTQWTRLLAPLAETPEYTAPDQPLDWWMTRDDFASLQFYEPGTLTGRIHGWIGVSQQTGRIYIFAFTM
ncbi:MAG TPA: hypothetical protein VMW27_22515 [Thermoanaerobaculia bacterium]|nr:hypothetical protein [Thermoanaerobaculia bacterium]